MRHTSSLPSMARFNRIGGEEMEKHMAKLEEKVYLGAKIEIVHGIKYIVCLGNNSKVKEYLDGKVSCNRFRLPAMVVGSFSNDDGYFRVDSLEYAIVSGEATCIGAMPKVEGKEVWFYDVVKDKYLVFDTSMPADEHISRAALALRGVLRNVTVGKVTNDTYDERNWTFEV